MAGGAGAGAGAGAGGGDMMGAAGMGSSMDWTFGQGKVWDEKTKRQMELLKALIGASANAGSHSVSPGQSPAPVKPTAWDPSTILALARLLSFRG